MDYIQGKPRSQIVLIESSLEEVIEQENPVRFIDAFVDSRKLDEFGFKHAKYAPEGRPPFHPGDLLKLYIYGCLNRIRTTRMLEKECKRNLEVLWLLKELTPDHNTIGNFRKDNPKAIKLVFRRMVTMCKQLYRRRQEIVEHPFGTIKRQWGFDYTLLKGKKKVDGDVGLIFIAYLFTRMRTIPGLKGLMEAIASLIANTQSLYRAIKRQIMGFDEIPSHIRLKIFTSSYSGIIS